MVFTSDERDAHRSLHEISQETQQAFSQARAKAALVADVMLSFEVDQVAGERVFSLRRRNINYFTESDGTRFDMTEYNGIKVPESVIIGSTPFLGFLVASADFADSAKKPTNGDVVLMGDGFVRRDGFVDSVRALFDVIHQYEAMPFDISVFYPTAEPRTTRVSISGLDILRDSSVHGRDSIPSVYKTGRSRMCVGLNYSDGGAVILAAGCAPEKDFYLGGRRPLENLVHLSRR